VRDARLTRHPCWRCEARLYQLTPEVRGWLFYCLRCEMLTASLEAYRLLLRKSCFGGGQRPVGVSLPLAELNQLLDRPLEPLPLR